MHSFCRAYLADIMKDVRKVVPAEVVKAAWGYKYSWGNQVEFHAKGPNGETFYFHKQGCCVWYAKAEGWDAYLKQFYTDYYKEMEDRVDKEVTELMKKGGN